MAAFRLRDLRERDMITFTQNGVTLSGVVVSLGLDDDGNGDHRLGNRLGVRVQRDGEGPATTPLSIIPAQVISLRRIEQVNTLELREGDLVLHEGMRIRLGARTECYREGRLVVWFPGNVENREELTMDCGHAVWPLTGLLEVTGQHAWNWTVQGNEMATWRREVSA